MYITLEVKRNISLFFLESVPLAQSAKRMISRRSKLLNLHYTSFGVSGIIPLLPDGKHFLKGQFCHVYKTDFDYAYRKFKRIDDKMMELEDMKREHSNRQTDINEQFMIDMIKTYIDNRKNFFTNSQLTSYMVAYVLFMSLLLNIHKLDNGLDWVSATLLIVYFVFFPFYSNSEIKRLKKAELEEMTYKECLKTFVCEKKQRFKAQTIILFLNPILFVSATILCLRLFLDFDLSTFQWDLMIVSLLTSILLVSVAIACWVCKQNNSHIFSLEKFIQESE